MYFQSTLGACFGGLPPAFAAAASQRRCSHLCCSFLTLCWRCAADLPRRLRDSAAAAAGGPDDPAEPAPAPPAPVPITFSLATTSGSVKLLLALGPHRCHGADLRQVDAERLLVAREPNGTTRCRTAPPLPASSCGAAQPGRAQPSPLSCLIQCNQPARQLLARPQAPRTLSRTRARCARAKPSDKVVPWGGRQSPHVESCY